MPDTPKFSYGGQAVIEGVMIRGRNHFSLAVRRQDGTIEHHSEPLNTLYTGRIRRIPLIRGAVVVMVCCGAKVPKPSVFSYQAILSSSYDVESTS